MKHKKALGIALGSALAGGAAVLAISQALASGIPATNALTYSGFLEDGTGMAITGSRNIAVEIYDAATAGNRLCDRPSTATDVTNGRFAVQLPDTCTTQVKANPDLWVEVLVAGASLGRTKLGAVPYAVEAGHAVSATTADTANAAGGALKTTVDGLSARSTRIVTAGDTRSGCPGTSDGSTDLAVVTFTLSKDTPVHLSGSDIRSYNGRADLLMVLDGAEVHRSISYTSAQAWISCDVSWSGVIPAGTHTAALRTDTTSGYGAANVWGCGAGYGHIDALIFE